jgi:hypothetical protein
MEHSSMFELRHYSRLRAPENWDRNNCFGKGAQMLKRGVVPMHKSLLVFHKDGSRKQKAIRAFKILLQYESHCHVETSDATQRNKLAKELVAMGAGDPGICEELLCQIMKQLTPGPHADQKTETLAETDWRAIALFVLLLVCYNRFACGESLEPYVDCFIFHVQYTRTDSKQFEAVNAEFGRKLVAHGDGDQDDVVHFLDWKSYSDAVARQLQSKPSMLPPPRSVVIAVPTEHKDCPAQVPVRPGTLPPLPTSPGVVFGCCATSTMMPATPLQGPGAQTSVDPSTYVDSLQRSYDERVAELASAHDMYHTEVHTGSELKRMSCHMPSRSKSSFNALGLELPDNKTSDPLDMGTPRKHKGRFSLASFFNRRPSSSSKGSSPFTTPPHSPRPVRRVQSVSKPSPRPRAPTSGALPPPLPHARSTRPRNHTHAHSSES